MGKKQTKTDNSRINLYYVEAFKSKEGSWNWAAFFFQSFWMIYRKIYFKGILFLFLDMFLFYVAYSNDWGFFSSLCLLAYKVFYGKFGNSLYAETVIERIYEGYHLMDEYKSTSLSLGCLGIAFIIVIACREYFYLDEGCTSIISYPFAIFTTLFLIIFYSMADNEANKSYLMERVSKNANDADEPLEIKIDKTNFDELVLKYLAHDHENHIFGNIITVTNIIIMAYILIGVIVDIKTDQSSLTKLGIKVFKNLME